MPATSRTWSGTPSASAAAALVEPGELVGVQAHRPRLQGDVGGGLAQVVAGDVGVLDVDDLDRRRPARARPAAPSRRCRGSGAARTRRGRRCRAARRRSATAGCCRRWAPSAPRASSARPRRRVSSWVGVEDARAPPRPQRLGEPLGAGHRCVAHWPLSGPMVPDRGWAALGACADDRASRPRSADSLLDEPGEAGDAVAGEPQLGRGDGAARDQAAPRLPGRTTGEAAVVVAVGALQAQAPPARADGDDLGGEGVALTRVAVGASR